MNLFDSLALLSGHQPTFLNSLGVADLSLLWPAFLLHDLSCDRLTNFPEKKKEKKQFKLLYTMGCLAFSPWNISALLSGDLIALSVHNFH